MSCQTNDCMDIVNLSDHSSIQYVTKVQFTSKCTTAEYFQPTKKSDQLSEIWANFPEALSHGLPQSKYNKC